MSLSGCKGKSFFPETKEKVLEFEIIFKMYGMFRVFICTFAEKIFYENEKTIVDDNGDDSLRTVIASTGI